LAGTSGAVQAIKERSAEMWFSLNFACLADYYQDTSPNRPLAVWRMLP
jgi:hypothetical protein